MHFCYLVASTEICGGVRVIFDQARALSNKGHQVTIRAVNGDHSWYHHPLQVEYVKDLSLPLKTKADVVIATFWTTVKSALQLNCPKVFHLCQGYEGDFIEYADIKTEIEETYRTPITKLTIGQWITDRLKVIYGEQYFKTHTIGQIVDTELFTPRKKYFRYKWKQWFNRPYKILLIGIFEAQVKGVPYALEAIKQLKQKGLNIELTRVSNQPFSDQEKRFFQADRYLISLTPIQMAKTYHQHDLLLSPSLPEEGFGLPFAEALASGLPCIATRIPSSSSFHHDQDYAVFAPPKDADAMVKAIETLLDDPQQMEFLSQRGPRIIQNQFSADAVAERLEQIV